MIFDWPHPALSPRVTNLRLVNRTRSAGESITGFEQVAETITQRWALSLEFNTIKREAILPFRAMIARLNGRANALRVPIRDPKLWPSDEAIGITNVPARDDQWRLVNPGLATADVSAVITAAAGVKTASVSLAAITDAAGVVFPGMYFGAGDDLHIITDIEWTGSTASLQFEPATRRAHTASPYRFRPTVTCRLANDEGGEHPLERGIITSPSLEMVEILPDELSLLEGGA